jgi:hypothetical protein
MLEEWQLTRFIINWLELISQATRAVKEETIEAFEELLNLNLSAFVGEMFDVWHTIIVAFSMTVVPDVVLHFGFQYSL